MGGIEGNIAGGMIHIVDDEEAIRDALCFLFTSRGVVSRGWPSGEAFLEDRKSVV
mgnify:CR=1 FL=1